MNWWLLTYIILGTFSGFIAGLFGVGGGLTIVPLLFMLFAAQGFPASELMHLALGTSMATIMVTSVSSMRAHHKHGAVRWDIVKGLVPGLLLGTLVGSMLTGLVPTHELAVIFTVIVYVASFQMIMNFRPKASRVLPGRAGMAAVGTGIGGVSSLVAAGGGFLSIPFMVLCNVSIHQAVGTSAALGFPIAIAGTVGYIVSGWNAAGLPGPSLGFVYLPAFFCVSAMTVLIAPYGAAWAHKLPVAKLKRAFGVFLGLLATKMLFTLL